MKFNKGGPSEWTDVLKTDGPVCQASIENLKFESEVEFRVIAENKAGPSEPSDSTGNHIVKHRNLKPRIDRTNLKNITVKAGKTLKLDAKVFGEPPPKVTTTFKEQTLENDNDVKVTNNVPYYLALEINNIKRKHNGKYTFKAVNRNGSDEVTIDIVVLAKSDAPGGPLEIDNIHAEGT